MQSIIPPFNCLTHNKTAKKAMESYIGILQKAFEHYQNLWEDYIKLQEKCGQCNVDSSLEMTVDTPCTKTKNETISHLNNVNVQGNDSIPLLELDTINMSHFNFNMRTDSLNAGESLHKNTDENNSPESPVFSRTFLRIDDNSIKKSGVHSSKVRYNSDMKTLDMKKHNSIEKVSSKYNHKLEINTTHHVETTFLPNGKRLKQSRLAFYPVKNNEKMILSSNIDTHKTANIMHNAEQNFIEDGSTANAIANATIIENATNNTGEIFEDVIEVSPTQRNVTSKVKRCLKFKRKIPIKHMTKISPSKNKCLGPSAVREITDDMDFGLCPPPKHTSIQMEHDKSLTNIAVNTLKDKIKYISCFSPIKMHNKTDIQIKKSIEHQKEDQLINKVPKNEILTQNINNFASEDETFYLPAEQDTYRDDMDHFNLEDVENKSPKKKMLLDKFNVLSKKKADISEQFNMRYKADRAKLNGWDCWECKEYYKNLSLSQEKLQKRKNQCSRHRHKYERPNTPEGFWDPEFPETLSCTYRQNEN